MIYSPCWFLPLSFQLKGACPPHKRKDLAQLVKSLNGDEAKIMEKIQEWWEEPAAPVEEWEDVNKKVPKKKSKNKSHWFCS